MKILTFLFLVVACTSCMKKYECACEIRTFDNGQVTTDNVTSEIRAKNKSKATTDCTSLNDSTYSTNYYNVTDCELK